MFNKTKYSVEPIVIDGSYGEGGGQILRTALSMSALLGVPVEVTNIRARRKNPGLQHQHLTAVRAVAAVANAEVKGDSIGSMHLAFRPGPIKCGEFLFDVGTAGSVVLVLQSLLPVLMYAPCRSKVVIKGGTDVPMAPPVDYFIHVVAKLLARLGANIAVSLKRRGHYPKGGGIIEVVVEPVAKIPAFDWIVRGEVVRIGGISHAVNLPEHVAERQARAAKETLSGFGVPVEISVEYRRDGLGPGSGIVLWAETDRGFILGSDSLGERGKSAEIVGREAAEKLLREISSGAALDSHMADMIIPFMALADGQSRVSVSSATQHMLTNIYIVEKILGVRFSVRESQPITVSVNGIGFVAHRRRV
ncbi:RNA 3'-terminal phosphate cyclase [Thermoproteus tenax]|uniref:RNA 3'-terminal phosphate cyclase n=1 Tax=Thermoproteus tenax (strain ATCC 35583 / DSM 2078 / JCM 9277 / NBRC 100435 / Kra 1) TaxID=768679 RepID=G4RL29_THETK|nr:RNA-3'-phosphate cyclase [Thermoproteus tenax Kra 1]